jgi:hypothetical protein
MVNEHVAGTNREKPVRKGVRRRTFLKGLFFGGVGGALAGTAGGKVLTHELRHEVQLAKDHSFETEAARWSPIYEIHALHEKALSPKNIDPTLQVLSLEMNYPLVAGDQGMASLSRPAQSLLVGCAAGAEIGDNPPQIILTQDVLDHLTTNSISIALGDLLYPDLKLFGMSEAKVRMELGSTLASMGISGLTINKLMSSPQETRRSFLKKFGLASFFTGIATMLPPVLLNTAHNKILEAAYNNMSSPRGWMRAGTLDSNFMPDFLNGLFRELVQANKLQILAQNARLQSLGEKPRIGFNWHYGHRGIEDWLRLGSDVTRKAILAFPDSVLRGVIAANNNDSRCLYATRLIQIPKSLTIVNSDVKQLAATFDPNERFSDQILEDVVLKAELAKRGLLTPVG